MMVSSVFAIEDSNTKLCASFYFMMQRDRWFRYKLSSYQTHRLPPPSEDFVPIATMERTPGLLECEHLNMHYVSEVRSIPSCAPFIVLQEWPMYCQMKLCKFDMRVCVFCTLICFSCKSFEAGLNHTVTGNKRWALHCQCKAGGYVQCLNDDLWLANWYNLMIPGSVYNLACPRKCYFGERVMSEVDIFMYILLVWCGHAVYVGALYLGDVFLVMECMLYGWCWASYLLIKTMDELCCAYAVPVDARSVPSGESWKLHLLGTSVKAPLSPGDRALLRGLMEPR
ncbi:control protein E4 34K [Human adenovirus 41]|uniref:Control protein E4 34K n=1 Tax=Human adenovirus F serotype 41 TaxID=10524 RepID=A0A7U3RWE0_ADE41|nr:control protein E4 34K [Human adenovirus 41]